jgi:signal transduction histidine kinase
MRGRDMASAFWALQLGGWTAYAGSKLAIFPIATIDAAWIAAKDVALTCAMRIVLDRLEHEGTALGARIAVAAGAAPLLAAASLSLSFAASSSGLVLGDAGTRAWLASAPALLYESLLFLAWSAVYLAVRHAVALQAERRRLVAALELARRARSRMLRQELDPHLVFNAFACLRGLVVEDAARARELIDDLVAWLRHALARDAGRPVTLARELDAARCFLAIQQKRFGARLDCRVRLDPEVAGVALPPLVLQPLLENAVKYGFAGAAPGAVVRVEVRARREGRSCVVEVRNSGRWLGIADAAARGPGAGIGIPNVRGRLAEAGGTLSLRERGGFVTARVAVDG